MNTHYSLPDLMALRLNYSEREGKREEKRRREFLSFEQEWILQLSCQITVPRNFIHHFKWRDSVLMPATIMGRAFWRGSWIYFTCGRDVIGQDQRVDGVVVCVSKDVPKNITILHPLLNVTLPFPYQKVVSAPPLLYKLVLWSVLINRMQCKWCCVASKFGPYEIRDFHCCLLDHVGAEPRSSRL